MCCNGSRLTRRASMVWKRSIAGSASSFFGQTFDAIAHEHGLVHVLQVRMERFGEQQFGVVLRSVDARRT